MRENMGLYRGKCKDNGEWVEGNYVRIKDGANPLEHYIYGKGKVDPETVGQFTGKTHESGVKIFEGDILEYWDTLAGVQRFVVAWDDSGAAWTMQWERGGCTRSIYLEPLLNGMKIVGNIHDNPELLEVK